eukprot:7089953-Lingulodinium_polyedra.AAC.1
MFGDREIPPRRNLKARPGCCRASQICSQRVPRVLQTRLTAQRRRAVARSSGCVQSFASAVPTCASH